MMFKKGQAAMEFLMTYGWAILVVLIAIGALAYFGVLNPNKFIGDRCTLSTGSGIFCGEFNADPDSDGAGVDIANVNLQLRNGLGEPITIVNVSYNYNNGAYWCGNGTAMSGGQLQPDTVIIFGLNTTTSCQAGITTTGAKLKGDLKVLYTVGSSTLLKVSTGSLIVTTQ